MGKVYSGIPLPEIEIADEGLFRVYDGDVLEEYLKDLDGIRLSMLSAIRDQETALATAWRFRCSRSYCCQLGRPVSKHCPAGGSH